MAIRNGARDADETSESTFIRKYQMSTGSTRSHLDVSQYLEFQKRVLGIFPYISCREENFQTFSITLVSVLLDAGSLFDSFAQTFIRCHSDAGLTFEAAGSVPNFQKKLDEKQFFTMRDYQTLFEPEFCFSDKVLNLNVYDDDFYGYPTACLHSALHQFELKPFKEWGSQSSLAWWKAFTDLKHDRSVHMSKGTLENVLLAAASAFVVLTHFHSDYIKTGAGDLEPFRLFTPLYWRLSGHGTVMRPIFL
jgi:hypothetical protein